MNSSTALQVSFFAVSIALIEVLCLVGVIPPFTMIPPSAMALHLYKVLAQGQILPHLVSTATAVLLAAVSAVVVGAAFGIAVHKMPRVRAVFDPIFATYYAVPVWVFYPLLIFMFGLNDTPKIILGFLYGFVIMIMNTLKGLDRVPLVLHRVARTLRMPPFATLMTVTLPAALPYLFDGIRLSIAYSFVAVVAAEFILSTVGLGYQIAHGYHAFDNNTLYSTVVLVLIISLFLTKGLTYLEAYLVRGRA